MSKFSLSLVRRPTSSRRITETVRNEVRTALKKLAEESIHKLNADVAGWEDKPEFSSQVIASGKKWEMKLGYDKKTDAGQHYKWVDEGTGERGGGEAYDIFPRDKKSLVFVYPPHLPKTLPSPSVPGLIKTGSPVVNVRKHVLAKGIYPRNFSKNLRKYLGNRTQVGGFRSTVEAAVKRAFRKEGISK